MDFARLQNEVIVIDSREKPKAIGKIESYFDSHGIKHISSKLYSGDYQLLSNGRLVVDRKQNLSEVCSNLNQQHERFRAEAERARSAGIQLVILVEHGGSIRRLIDVQRWINPRRYQYCRTYGIPTYGDVEANIAEFVSHGGRKPPTSGEQLYKTMRTMTERYGIEWAFCSKDHTGEKILQILTREWE